MVCAVGPRVATCQTSEQQIEDLFRSGQQALQRGEFVRATEDFKKVLTLDPSLMEAEVNLGLAYQSMFQYNLAVQHLTKALSQRPNLLGATVIVGMDQLKLGAPDKAVPFLQRALKLDPSNPDASQALAAAYLAQENFRGAAEEYRQIALADRDQSEAWFKLGHEYLKLAASLAYRAARLYRESAWGHRFLGDLLFQRSRWEDAVKEYHKALSADSQQPGLHALQGQTYLRAGKLSEAESEFRAELQLDSANEQGWLGLATVQLAGSQATEALHSIQKAWGISPEFLTLQRNFPSMELPPDTAKASIAAVQSEAAGPAKDFLLSALYAAANQTALSETQWQAFRADFLAWQKSPNARTGVNPHLDPCKRHRYAGCAELLQARAGQTDPDRLLLGKTRLTLQQYQSAADVLAQVRGVGKENAETSYWLARTYQALGADAYARLEESFPNSWRTHQLRAEGYALHQDFDNAEKEFQAALQLQPNQAELHEALAEFYLDNHLDGAEGELEKALTFDPSQTHSLYLLGRLYVQNRENEKAIPYLKRALQLQPDLAEASSLLGTAYVRLGQFAKAVPNLEKAAAFDHYGNLHYQLFLAYKNLGEADLARKALEQSQHLRTSSLEHDQALILGTPQVDAEPQ